MQHVKAVLIAASSAFLINSASAGVLGERAVTATFDYVAYDDDALDDGLGVTVGYRQAVATGIDIDVALTYLDSGFDGGPSVDLRGAGLGGTFYVTNQATKPFVAVGLSWANIQAFGSSENEVFYSVAAGVEFKASDALTLIPYVAWDDAFDSDIEGSGSVGLNADYSIDTAWSTVLGASISDDGDLGFSLGVRIKF